MYNCTLYNRMLSSYLKKNEYWSMYWYERFPIYSKGGGALWRTLCKCVTCCGEKYACTHLKTHRLSLEGYLRNCNNRCHHGDWVTECRREKEIFFLTSFSVKPVVLVCQEWKNSGRGLGESRQILQNRAVVTEPWSTKGPDYAFNPTMETVLLTFIFVT